MERKKSVSTEVKPLSPAVITATLSVISAIRSIRNLILKRRRTGVVADAKTRGIDHDLNDLTDGQIS